MLTWMLASSSSRGDWAGITSASELSEEAFRFRFFPTTGVIVLGKRRVAQMEMTRISLL